MVKEVTAYAAENGGLFLTKLDALEFEAIGQLKDLGFKFETRDLIVKRAREVVDVLKVLVKHQPQSAPEQLAIPPQSETITDRTEGMN